MRKISHLLFAVLTIAITTFSTNELTAQCGTFADSPDESKGLEAHVLYRDAVKAKNFTDALPNWKVAYDIAPAADGKRPFHFTDGRAIYMDMYKNESNEEKKKEYAATVLRLYDEQIACYGEEGEAARLLGRKAFDMFYTLRSPYQDVRDVLKEAIDKGGNSAEYITFVPYATVVEYLFTNEKMEKEEARAVYTQLNEIADYNIANAKKYNEEYEQAKGSMNGIFARIENYIFDCAYFVDKLRPEYEANPEDPTTIEGMIRTLKKRGCEETEPMLVELEGKWAKYAAAENARRQAEFEANNPGMMAKKMYDQGDYSGAIAKYKEAISEEVDPSKQAGYWFSIASIQFRKQKSYSAARTSARKAGELRPGWGRPYMLIGDMYGSSARNCGDAWGQRLAILAAVDKYSYAKSIDPEVAADARQRIGKYSASFPEKQEGFMRGVKAGQTQKVGCWIGESVKVRFSD